MVDRVSCRTRAARAAAERFTRNAQEREEAAPYAAIAAARIV
jgi:hypothetical protein